MTNPENKNARRRFLKQLENAVRDGANRIAAQREGKLLLLAVSFLIILFLGAEHPVFSNGMLNLSYHAAAFLGTLLLWVALAFLLGGLLFNVIKKPPPWLVLGVVAITLVAASYARLQIDDQIKKISGVREEVETRLGAKFDIREFHERILENGAVPLVTMRSHVEEWIEENE